MILPVNSLRRHGSFEVRKPDRVYFLGAGASKAIYPDLPLATDLTLRALVEYDNSEYRDYAAKPLQSVCSLLGGSLMRLGCAPIEEVLNQRELSAPDRTSIVQCILYRLNLVNRGACPLIQSWLTRVRSDGHAIVTTNYDTVCERNLHRLHDPSFVVSDGLEWLDYGISYDLCATQGNFWRKCESDKCLLLLKLHGSVSWSRCLNATCGRYMLSPVAAFAAPQAMDEPYLHWAACPDCKGDPWAVLVPPVKNKQYDDPALRQVWHRAEHLLRAAREIVFAGYSLPPTDSMIRSLLGSCRDPANLQKVFVVDRNAPSVAGRFREIYGDLVCEGGSDWRGYLQDMLDQTQLESAVTVWHPQNPHTKP